MRYDMLSPIPADMLAEFPLSHETAPLPEFTKVFDPDGIDLFRDFTLVNSRGQDIFEIFPLRDRASNERREKPKRTSASPQRIAELAAAYELLESEGSEDSPFDDLIGDALYYPE